MGPPRGAFCHITLTSCYYYTAATTTTTTTTTAPRSISSFHSPFLSLAVSIGEIQRSDLTDYWTVFAFFLLVCLFITVFTKNVCVYANVYYIIICPSTPRVTRPTTVSSSPTPVSDNYVLPTLEHSLSVGRTAVLETGPLPPQDHKSGTVCRPVSDNVGCHTTSSGGY